MPKNYSRRIIEICLLISLCLPLYGAENSMVAEVKGDVFIMTSSNRWERVYEGERFNSAVRIKTEQDSSATLVVNGSLNIYIDANSVLELNDMFSDRSNIISVGLFKGGFMFRNGNEKRVFINTPFFLFVAGKGKFSIKMEYDFSVRVIPEGANLFHISESVEKRITESVSFNPGVKVDYKTCAKMINDNVIKLKEHLEGYDRLSGDFERVSESILSSKKNKAELKNKLNGILKNIFALLLKINEAKNRINVFSMILREDVEQDNVDQSGEPIDDINETIESLRAKYDIVMGLKERVNNILNSEMYSIFKTFDTIANSRKR